MVWDFNGCRLVGRMSVKKGSYRVLFDVPKFTYLFPVYVDMDIIDDLVYHLLS